MLVTIEYSGRANDTEVDIPFIMENSTTSRTTTHELHWSTSPTYTCRIITELVKSWKVYLHPWVLVSAKDDTWIVGVEEEDC
jgi:hypothetical protein